MTCIKSRMIFAGVLFAASLATLCQGPSAHALEVEFEQERSLPLVYLNVAIKAGSAIDPKGQYGITNFMGEMLLRGTKSRTKEQIDLALDQLGAQLEVEVRPEVTILRGAVLSYELDSFLKLVSEIITQPSFPEHEIRKLKAEIGSALLEQLGNDTVLVGRNFNKFLFQDHPYGKPVLGTTADIRGLSRAQIVKHYDRIVREKQLLVVGTGDAEKSTIEAWAKSLAKDRPGGEEFEKVPPPKPVEKTRMLIVDKPDRTQTQITGGQIGVKMTDKSFFPLFLANHAFGGGSFSARLMTEVRVKRGWSYGAYSYFRHGREPRSWQFYLFPAAQYTPEALAHVLSMVRDFEDKGITREEFEFAKTSLVNSSGFMYNTPSKSVENLIMEKTLDLHEGVMRSYG